MVGELQGSQERWALAGPILGGAAVAVVGAAMASTYEVWSLDRAERIEQLAGEALGVWIWGNILLGTGAAVTAAGVAALSGTIGGALTRVGGALAVAAGAIAAIGFLFQGVGGAEAAEILVETGEVPHGFLVADAVQEGLLVFFGGVMSLATLGVGFGSLQVESLPRGVGLSAGGASIVSLALLPLNVPFFALFGSLALGIGLLIARGESASTR